MERLPHCVAEHVARGEPVQRYVWISRQRPGSEGLALSITERPRIVGQRLWQQRALGHPVKPCGHQAAECHIRICRGIGGLELHVAP